MLGEEGLRGDNEPKSHDIQEHDKEYNKAG
jgi:hypothetical protein